MTRRLVALSALFIGALVVAAPAGAQQYPPQQEGIQTSDSTVSPGQPITVAGCCIAGEVTITFESVVLGTTTASPADGSFSVQVTIPADASPGTHTITASGQAFDGSGPVVYSTTVTVSGAAAPTGAGLPRTGSSSTIPLTRVAIMLVVVGSAFVIGARRRSTTSRAAERVDA